MLTLIPGNIYKAKENLQSYLENRIVKNDTCFFLFIKDNQETYTYQEFVFLCRNRKIIVLLNKKTLDDYFEKL